MSISFEPILLTALSSSIISSQFINTNFYSTKIVVVYLYVTVFRAVGQKIYITDKFSCINVRIAQKRVPTGIPNFDTLIEGGFLKDSVNLVAGSAGSGKTIFALQFLVNG